MRLLYFDTDGRLCLQEFDDEDSVPEYAILSHTWCRPSSHELNFQDVKEGQGQDKPGYQKAIFCLEKAAEKGIKYCWLDTCCIDKTSSAELTTAINSMFRWYLKASQCYVYLADVSIHNPGSDGSPVPHTVWEPAFRQSRWFTRGWTLQELLAPSHVDFFSKEKAYIGSKISLQHLILEITGLPIEVFHGTPLSTFTHDERKSWANIRQTTKPEDQVYCLLGILEVSMSALYGEGVELARNRLEMKIRHQPRMSQVTSLGKRSRTGLDNEEERLPAKSSRETIKPSIDTESRAALLESLRFDQMEARQLTIKSAHVKTCKWLLQDTLYLDWLDDTRFDGHHGFLWIKGKPGSGKSTLMKFGLTNAWKRKKSQNLVILSFFFNARGNSLEKSTAGAYRTLLSQLLEQCPSLQIELGHLGLTMSRINDEYQWEVETLKELLLEGFQSLSTRKVMCFVDALDECDEKEVRDMVSFFENIGKPSGKIRICFASRHYPHITIQHGLDLTVEGTEGHTQDIEAYLASELKIGCGKRADEVRGQLLERASGVFIWVALVVEILNKEFDSGRIEGLLRRLGEIPDDLHKLFRDILTRDASNKESMLLCIQWILFADKPLTPDQLYYAMRSGVEEAVISRPEPEQVTSDVVQRYILNASKGLAETTKTSSRNKNATVQFIHESVRDFLLKEDGLLTMWPELGPDVERSCHTRLAQCCRLYLDADLSEFAPELYKPPKASTDEAKALSASIKMAFPFLEYAITNLLFHLDKAIDGSVTETAPHSLTPDGFERYKTISNALAKYQTHRYALEETLLYVVCGQGYQNLAQQELKRLASVQQQDVIRALGAATQRHNEDIVREFSEIGVRIQTPNEHFLLYRPVKQAIEKDSRRVIELLLNMGLVSGLTKHSNRDTKRTLETWFLAAVGQGMVELVQLLIDRGADVNAQGGYYSNALQAACYEGNETIVQLLIDRGTDVNAQGGYYSNALQAASLRGHDTIVQLLIDRGVDVNAQGGPCGNALQAASSLGHDTIVQLLIDRGADVNAQGGYYSNALQAACYEGNETIVQLLIDRGADVNTQGGPYGNALQVACYEGNETIVQLLIDRGADVNTQGGPYGNALQVACDGGNETIVQLLIDRGADVNAQGGIYGNALYAASSEGRDTIVQLLRDHGAHSNA